MEHYINGVITNGSYFTYKGVRYGRGTKVLFTSDFYAKENELQKYYPPKYYVRRYFRIFHSIEHRSGKIIWKLNKPNFIMLKPDEYDAIDPDRDIEKIITPVWYYEPKELVKLRFSNGTWFFYIWKQTLTYALCLLVSPIFQQWYLIWTIGLYAYLRLCYIELSKGELNRGW